MAKDRSDVQSGAGGYIKVRQLRFDIGRWELVIDPRLIERTNTTPRVTQVDALGVATAYATVIGTRYRATVFDPSGKLEIPWDNCQTPDTAGLVAGAEVHLVLFRGSSLKGYKVYHTCVGAVELMNDASKDVVRAVISFHGGDICDEKDRPYAGALIYDDPADSPSPDDIGTPWPNPYPDPYPRNTPSYPSPDADPDPPGYTPGGS